MAGARACKDATPNTHTEGTKRDARPGLPPPSPGLTFPGLMQATVQGVELVPTGSAGGITSALGRIPPTKQDTFHSFLSPAGFIQPVGWRDLGGQEEAGKGFQLGATKRWALDFFSPQNSSNVLQHLEPTWHMDTSAGVMEGRFYELGCRMQENGTFPGKGR